MYYGARYYDPRTSVWQNPDPILGKYLTGKPNGGVGNSFNLNLYAYTAQNPVNYVDPEGKFFKAENKGDREHMKAEISFTARIVNKSGKGISEKNKGEIIDQIKAGIEKSYNGRDGDHEWKTVKIDIEWANDENDKKTDDEGNVRHTIFLQPKEFFKEHKDTKGKTPIGGTDIHLKADEILKSGYIDGIELGRLSAHELAHSAGYDGHPGFVKVESGKIIHDHPEDDYNDHLMKSGGYGTKLSARNIYTFTQRYGRGELNRADKNKNMDW